MVHAIARLATAAFAVLLGLAPAAADTTLRMSSQ